MALGAAPLQAVGAEPFARAAFDAPDGTPLTRYAPEAGGSLFLSPVPGDRGEAIIQGRKAVARKDNGTYFFTKSCDSDDVEIRFRCLNKGGGGIIFCADSRSTTRNGYWLVAYQGHYLVIVLGGPVLWEGGVVTADDHIRVVRTKSGSAFNIAISMNGGEWQTASDVTGLVRGRSVGIVLSADGGVADFSAAAADGFLDAGTLASAHHTDTTISIHSAADASGGKGPYVHGFRRAMQPAFSASRSPFVDLPSKTTRTLRDTGLEPNTYYTYVRSVTDARGQKATTGAITILTDFSSRAPGVVVFEGDSLTRGEGIAELAGLSRVYGASYPAVVTSFLPPAWQTRQFGLGGQPTSAMGQHSQTQIDPLSRPSFTRSYFVLWAGENDCNLDPQTTPAQRITQLTSWVAFLVDARLAAGWKTVVLCTLEPDVNPKRQAIKDGYNAALRRYAAGKRNVLLCDLANLEELRDPKDKRNRAADTVHLTDAGYAAVGRAVYQTIARDAGLKALPSRNAADQRRESVGRD